VPVSLKDDRRRPRCKFTGGRQERSDRQGRCRITVAPRLAALGLRLEIAKEFLLDRARHGLLGLIAAIRVQRLLTPRLQASYT